MEPGVHLHRRAVRGVLEGLEKHGDRLLELPERLGAVAGSGEGGDHDLELEELVIRRGRAGEGKRVLADGECRRDIAAGEDFGKLVVGVLAETAAVEDRVGELVEHRRVLRLRELAGADARHHADAVLLEIGFLEVDADVVRQLDLGDAEILHLHGFRHGSGFSEIGVAEGDESARGGWLDGGGG